MAVSSVGTPAQARAATGTVTATWGTGQTRTAGNVLVAAVSATSDTSIGMITAALAGKWALRTWAGNATDNSGYPGHVTVAFFWCIAWGSDAAPVFSVTPATGNVTMTVTMFELAGVNLFTDPFDTLGAYRSGFAAATITSQSAPTYTPVSVAGEYAIALYAQERAAGTNTWNAGSGWTNVATDGATSSTGHTAVDVLANPAAGSVLGEATPHWTTGTTAYGAGITVVISPPVVPSQGFTLYKQAPSGTVTSGGTTAPAAGTSESWTVSPAAAAGFPAVSAATIPMMSFHGCDPNAPSELFQVITCPGGTSAGQSWTVLRGAEGTTPVTHAAGFTISQVASAGDLGGHIPVYNVRAAPWNAAGTGGTADAGDGAAIQAALTACDANGGGIVYLPPGVYVSAVQLQIGSNTVLQGAGKGISTIRQASNPAYTGYFSLDLLRTIGNNGGINIAVRYLTLDGNEAGTPTLPAGFSDSKTLRMASVTGLEIDSVEIINSLSYAIMLQGCEYFSVSRCHITQGQDVISGYNQQDAIHIQGCRFGTVTDNNIDTGASAAAGGDDCICCQSVSPDKPCTDITIKGNVLRSATRAVSVVLGGGAVSNIDVTGNSVYATISDGFILSYTLAGSPVASNINFTSNVLANVGAAGNNCGINLQGVNAGLGSGSGNGWQDVTISANQFYNLQSPGSFAIAAAGGSRLSVIGNVMDLANVYTGILVGNSGGPVTEFTISDNVIDMSTATASPALGIQVQDSTNGTITGNYLAGSNTANSVGIWLDGVGASVSGVTVTGNRCTGWPYGTAETNGGVAPDYNTFLDNNCHGCANATLAVGPHTLAQPNVIDTGGIADTEQFTALTAAYTLTSTTSVQKLFNATANGALTVQPGTYFFECFFSLSGMSGTSGNCKFDVKGAGTATLASAAWSALGLDATTPGTAAAAGGSFTATNVSSGDIVTAGTGTAMFAQVKGIIRVSAAGTLIPSVGLTTAAAAIVGVNSWFRLTPAGISTLTFAGNWS